MITIKYFARLREAFALSEEQIKLDDSYHTVADLIELLRQRGEPWATEFSTKNIVLMALNHEICDTNAELRSGDELGFFPPVTGG